MLEERLVMKLAAILLAGASAALAGTALAATGKTHVMNVSLPDGSVAHVEYVGDVPPKVTVAPAPLPGGFGMLDLPSPVSFDRMFEQMDRQMRKIEQIARQPAGIPGAPGMNVASTAICPRERVA